MQFHATKNGQYRSDDIKTPEAVVAFAHTLFEHKDGKYGCSLLFPKGADISELKAAAQGACKAKWGAKTEEYVQKGLIKTPFLDGDGPQGISKKTGEPHAGFPGHVFIRVSSGEDRPPAKRDRNAKPLFDKAECPSGSRVYAVVNAFTWENGEGGKGVSFGISGIQVAKKAEGDEILGGTGGPDVDKFFEKIPGGDDEGSSPAGDANDFFA